MVAAVNSAATPIASRYEAARSSREQAPLLIHYHIFKNAGTSFKESVTQACATSSVICSGCRRFLSARQEEPRQAPSGRWTAGSDLKTKERIEHDEFNVTPQG